MKLKSLAAVAALLVSGLAGAAVVTIDAGPYKLSYDNAAASDFVLGAVTAGGFEWSFKDVSVQSFSAGVVTKDLLLPQFTVTANSGWNLGNTLNSAAGNVVFFEAGASASTSLTAGGTLSVLGGATTVLPQTALNRSASGYYFGATSGALNDATAFTVKDVKLVLTANAGAASFAAITAQSQNKLAYSFTAEAVPVPEPESYALLLAGLGAIGLFARRRQPR